ncbi:Imm1 family immunity protein [Kitasatospora sp. NPDC088134]|uniref:Imm1 family immunity protein n=1 Tax=Kitasatospora sp. NPDC088134 TaxID=3364071 RepID=UPI0037F231FA
MILRIATEGGIEYRPTRPEEIGAMISEVFRATTPKEVSPGVYSAGSQAWFVVGETSADEGPRAFLRATVDEHQGYGALSWSSDLRTGGIHEFLWLSDNPAPPRADPRLTASPHGGYDYDPACALPLAQVRAAVEEYCASGTGERPACINWVTGDFDGTRHPESLFTEQPEAPRGRSAAKPWSESEENPPDHPF